jgi:hypothetical protein
MSASTAELVMVSRLRDTVALEHGKVRQTFDVLNCPGLTVVCESQGIGDDGDFEPLSQSYHLATGETFDNAAEALLAWDSQHSDLVLFRNRSGAAYSKDTLGDDFRDIRAAEFGPGEKRQLQDMRRSAAIEATAGGADPAAMANKMGNSIDENRELQNTYVPSSEAIIRTVDDARLIGRRRIRETR